MKRDYIDYENCRQFTCPIPLGNSISKPREFVAVSKEFARARKHLNAAEYKTLIYALCNHKYESVFPAKITLEKRTVAKIVGINTDTDHLSVRLKEVIGKMAEHSWIETENYGEYYKRGKFINKISFIKNGVILEFNEEWLCAFGQHEAGKYITLYSDDIFKLKTERSIRFYEYLRLHSDTREECNRNIGIKEFKAMFDIPYDGVGSYMRKNGDFNRKSFELRVIDPLVNELCTCKMIQLIFKEKKLYYIKHKRGNYVQGYEFFWKIRTSEEIEGLYSDTNY